MQIGTTVHLLVVPLDSTARATIHNALTARLPLLYSRTFGSKLKRLRFCVTLPSLICVPGPRARCASSAVCSLAPGDLAPLAWGLVSPLGAPGHNHIPTPSHSDVMTLRIPSSVLQQPQFDRVFLWEFMQDLSFSSNQTGYGT